MKGSSLEMSGLRDERSVGKGIQEDLSSSIVMTRAQIERELQTNSLNT